VAVVSIFVSHSHHDNAFCQEIVQALRDAGADVWYDEQNLDAGLIMDEVQREIGRRPIFIVILSKAAFAAKWVRRETKWAYEMADRDPTRLIIPITASPIAREDFDPAAGWLFMSDYKRIEAPNYQPYSTAEAVHRLLHVLALTPKGATPEPVAPQPGESVGDMLARGKALLAQKRYADALPLFQRATELAPGNAVAWGNKGVALINLGRYAEALEACDRALTLDPNNATVWSNKGGVLRSLGRYAEALEACDRALTLDPNLAYSWGNKGATLINLGRHAEALEALDRALSLNPNYAIAWSNKGVVLSRLGRHAGALEAYDRALALDSNYTSAWNNKGSELIDLGRHAEALEALDRALSLNPNLAIAWSNKGAALRRLGRGAEAQAAEQRAKELGG
jgi:tetratricopeptide (TPR) repeat protein